MLDATLLHQTPYRPGVRAHGIPGEPGVPGQPGVPPDVPDDPSPPGEPTSPDDPAPGETPIPEPEPEPTPVPDPGGPPLGDPDPDGDPSIGVGDRSAGTVASVFSPCGRMAFSKFLAVRDTNGRQTPQHSSWNPPTALLLSHPCTRMVREGSNASFDYRDFHVKVQSLQVLEVLVPVVSGSYQSQRRPMFHGAQRLMNNPG